MNQYLQMYQQDINNSNTLIPGMINQQQPIQDNDNNDKNKKDKDICGCGIKTSTWNNFYFILICIIYCC